MCPEILPPWPDMRPCLWGVSGLLSTNGTTPGCPSSAIPRHRAMGKRFGRPRRSDGCRWVFLEESEGGARCKSGALGSLFPVGILVFAGIAQRM